MRVIGKDIGNVLDPLFEELRERARVEQSWDLRIEPFEATALSSIDFDDGAVVVLLHRELPRRAVAHVFGVALQHVRQRLDKYPAVVSGPEDFEGADLVRTTLGELVMASEAEERLAPLRLDASWEVQQRHEGLKSLLAEAPDEWNEPDSFGHLFGALQYARFSLEHPPELWAALIDPFKERLPAAAEAGERLTEIVHEHGWSSADACLVSLISARDALGIGRIALVQDMRNDAVV